MHQLRTHIGLHNDIAVLCNKSVTMVDVGTCTAGDDVCHPLQPTHPQMQRLLSF